MAPSTNLTMTRRTIRALRRAERLTDTDAGLARLALTTAQALDDVLAQGEKAYAVAQASRVHLLALEALLALPAPVDSDADGFDNWLAEISRPGPGAGDGAQS
jgi:hypothetical protein